MLVGCIVIILISCSIVHTGLLTVNPSQRLTIKDLETHDWLRDDTSSLPHTPLMTPGILGRGLKRNYIDSALNVAFGAFHKAQREQGFTLMDVENAPLAKRRKLKKTISGDRDSRSTTSSDQSSCGDLSPRSESQIKQPISVYGWSTCHNPDVGKLSCE